MQKEVIRIARNLAEEGRMILERGRSADAFPSDEDSLLTRWEPPSFDPPKPPKPPRLRLSFTQRLKKLKLFVRVLTKKLMN
jgi:hypothetical protein